MKEAQTLIPRQDVIAARQRKEAAANAQLMQTGMFAALQGPEGGIPVQAWGRLESGEAVSFRARNTQATLTISKPGKPPRTFTKVIGEQWQCAGLLEPEEAASLIRQWVEEYRRS